MSKKLNHLIKDMIFFSDKIKLQKLLFWIHFLIQSILKLLALLNLTHIIYIFKRNYYNRAPNEVKPRGK